MRREYASYPVVPKGSQRFATFETNEDEASAHKVPAETAEEAARLWGLVRFERLESGGVTDITAFEVFVRDGDALRWFDITVELHPRVFVQEVRQPAGAGSAPAGGAR